MRIEESGDSEDVNLLKWSPNTPQTGGRRRWIRPIVRAVFGLAGLLGVLIAFANAWSSRGPIFPTAEALAIALFLSLATMLAAPLAWVALIGPRADRRALKRGYYSALFGRYIPGGVWQAVGQVGFARNAGVAWAEATTAFIFQSFAQLAAAGVVSLGVVFSGATAPSSLRIGALACLLFLATLSRPWMAFSMRFTLRPLDGSVQLPQQREILVAFGWSLLTICLGGLAFWVLLSSLLPEIGLRSAVSAFAFSWAIGFIAVVFPSGIGVREGVLVATLGAPAGPVLAASIAQRLVGIVSEVVVVMYSRGVERRHR